MLENTRFDPGETKNDPDFARELAEGHDLFVNDAFGSAHRAHASTVGVAQLLPAYAGLLLERELEELGKLLGEVERPFVLVSGGAKVEDKLGVLRNLGGRADTVLVGGKMAEQLREENPLGFPVELPHDVVAAAAFEADAEPRVVPYDEVPEGWLGLDIGPETREAFADEIGDGARRSSGTARWASSSGRASRRARRRSPRRSPARTRYSVVGGGDSVRALERARPRRPHLVGLDRRRRGARAARGQGAPRRGRDPGGLTDADRRQLEDVQGAARDARRSAARSRPPEGVEVGRSARRTSRSPAAVESGQTVFAQNVHWAAEGAYTGEVSAPMLLELGVAGAIVGHSERRQYFGETDETRRRAAPAPRSSAGLRVIACVGESEEERESGEMELVLRVQVETIADAAAGGNEGLVVAYEPVWAIGTGKTATPEQAHEAHAFIKSLLDVPVLYGGSVKPENAAELLAQPESTARSSAAPRSKWNRSRRFAERPPRSRSPRRPRRLGLRAARARERRRAGARRRCSTGSGPSTRTRR